MSRVDGYRAWGQRLSNWGRWGEDDVLGTLNWITPAAIAGAAALVRTGEVVTLGLPLDANGPQPPDGVRPNPVHRITRSPAVPPEPGGFQWMDDTIEMSTQCATQLDALAHVAYDGSFYNGVPVSTFGEGGATRLGIETLRRGITGRGVLVDLPRHLGVDRLDPDHVVTPELVDACLAAVGLAQAVGDIVLIRTGWIRTLRDAGPAAYMAREPGVSLEFTDWLARRRTAFVASDNWGLEVVPPRGEENMPVHCVLVRDLGMTIGEMFDLEELAATCQRLGRWEFLFSAHPLQITGGTGSPLEPKAIL